MSAKVTLARGGEGELVRVEGEILHTVLPRAFAPGAPVELSVQAPPREVPVSGKTVGSKKRGDGRFDVRLRLVNLRRVDRELLAGL